MLLRIKKGVLSTFSHNQRKCKASSLTDATSAACEKVWSQKAAREWMKKSNGFMSHKPQHVSSNLLSSSTYMDFSFLKLWLFEDIYPFKHHISSSVCFLRLRGCQRSYKGPLNGHLLENRRKKNLSQELTRHNYKKLVVWVRSVDFQRYSAPYCSCGEPNVSGTGGTNFSQKKVD